MLQLRGKGGLSPFLKIDVDIIRACDFLLITFRLSRVSPLRLLERWFPSAAQFSRFFQSQSSLFIPSGLMIAEQRDRGRSRNRNIHRLTTDDAFLQGRFRF
jgi:hypothetical protein